MWKELLGLEKKPANLVELITPRHSFAEVVLPDETRQQLYEALTQIDKHRLIFGHWGLGEKHPTGMGLAFNFAGPPGTGKSICAEAVAYALGRKLLRVRYAELESCWAGETSKNIRAVFRDARTQGAVLFFDEADSIATRRFSNVQSGYEREANQAVNVLLVELEEHEGVVIFATNLASNFDPAFERRIRTHILFQVPNATERARIWQLQVHPQKTPLGTDVDFAELAERYEVSGGDIRNAVLKAAQMAAAEDGPDETKRILQKHFVAAIEQVNQSKRVMQQNSVDPESSPSALRELLTETGERLAAVEAELQVSRAGLELLALNQKDAETQAEALEAELKLAAGELAAWREAQATQQAELQKELTALRSALVRQEESQATALQEWRGTQDAAVTALTERVAAQEQQLRGVTLIPWSRSVTVTALSLLSLLLLALGALGARMAG